MKPKTCSRADCERPAYLYPTLLLRTSLGGQALEASMPLAHCRRCAAKAKVSDFMRTKGYLQICEELEKRGLAAPVRELTELRFDELEKAPPQIEAIFGDET